MAKGRKKLFLGLNFENCQTKLLQLPQSYLRLQKVIKLISKLLHSMQATEKSSCCKDFHKSELVKIPRKIELVIERYYSNEQAFLLAF